MAKQNHKTCRVCERKGKKSKGKKGIAYLNRLVKKKTRLEYLESFGQGEVGKSN
jgi:hypothetical protein